MFYKIERWLIRFLLKRVLRKRERLAIIVDKLLTKISTLSDTTQIDNELETHFRQILNIPEQGRKE